MAIKYCIAKDFGAVRLYFAGATNCTETWISDINSPSVVWWNGEKDAQKALRGPSSYVVPVRCIDKAEALERACRALKEALEVGGIAYELPCLFAPADVLESLGVRLVKSQFQAGEDAGTVFFDGYLHGVPVCTQVRKENL